MAKQQGLDDIGKAIMAAIKAARKGAAKELTVNTGEGTSTRLVKAAYDNNFKGKAFIDSKVPIKMETYAKGSSEYKKAMKELRAKQVAFKKVGKVSENSAKNKEYTAVLEAEARLNDWMNPKNFDSMPADRALVAKYMKKNRK